MKIEKAPISTPQTASSEMQKKNDPVPKQEASRPIQDPKWALPSYNPFHNPGKKEDYCIPTFTSGTNESPSSSKSTETHTQEDWERIYGKFDINFA